MTTLAAPAGHRPMWAALGGIVAVGLAVVGLAGVLLSASAPHRAPVSVTITLALGFLPMGLFVVHARPGHVVGRLVLTIGLLALAAVTAAAWSDRVVAAWAAQWLWWPPLALLPIALLAFPDGRVPVGPRRWLARLVALGTVASTTALALAASFAPRTLLTSAESAPPAARPWLLAAAAGATVVVLLALAVVVDMVRRVRSAEPGGQQRSQLLCLLPAGVLLVVGIVLDAAGMPYALVPGALALPLGMGLAILRHGVDDLDLAVNRTLVWIAMSGAVLAAFAVATALASTTVLAGRPLLVSAIGTGLVAAGFDPLRRLVQRTVDRMLFGDRDRPQEIVHRLGRRMHQASDPGGMLVELVTTLTAALRVPYARMLVETGEPQPVVVAEWGRAQPETHVFPMVAHGEPVGLLEVAARRAGESFTVAEDALLRQVAGQAAIAARAHRLTLDLRAARTVLVRAREEERLRLRRDLHDGLGPALAGTRMQLVAARGRLGATTGRDEAVAAMLSDALDVLGDCTSEVRRVVDGLRPADLDRGLDVALHQRARALFADRQVAVDVRCDVPALPAAVEVAAYRIATEAMTNVAVHAHASTCRVEVRPDRERLLVRVTDDGRGGAQARAGGVGLDSMVGRAEELGGTCVVLDASPGTRVEAHLPLGGR